MWIVSEDNNPYVGAYGDKLAHTPTIDGLARKGVLFRHIYSNAPVCAPSRFGILTGVYPESCAPANHMRANARFPKQFRTYPELLRGAGYHCTNNSKTDYNCDVNPEQIWDVQGPKGHWRTRPAGKPFMAVFNYETTHESRLFHPTQGRVTPDMVSIPPFLPDTPAMHQDFASYYNLMEQMDGQLAERLAELEADGLAEDTIIFHYSDNGGVLPRSKRYCYEEGLSCEMVVYAPPKWRHLLPVAPGQEVTSPVSFIDLAPTVLALAGVAQPAQMVGQPFLGPRAARKTYAFGMRNRMDERYDFQRTVTDGRWRYIRNYMPHRPWGQHQAFEWLAKGYQDWEAAHRAGTLNADQDRFFHTKPFEELYDLSQDPHELHNLADKPEADAELARLSKELDAHMLAIHDNGFIPEGMAGEGYFESRDRKAYPLPEVMAMARLAAGGKGSEAQLVAGLNHPLPVMRYWAATGLLIGGQQGAKPALLAALAKDSADQVRVVAAEALVRLGEIDEPVRVLTALAAQDKVWPVQLQALNALTYIGDHARPALPVVQQAAQSEQEYVRNAGRYLSAVLEGKYTPSMPIMDFERLIRRMKV
ncbi:sulfatase-like hydrolase/transferase [Novosphingobium sp. SCN 63-17]|uniref:sulfatase-like hydrolase/transferase n=1 Tax=Novosphingobium sp. SCN 63-17 TaxID=1660120 RepID=UPI0025CE27F6|nr:sulfatase-like hydrolase/transferase [Novosphingobium sp. SCN 63-17]